MKHLIIVLLVFLFSCSENTLIETEISSDAKSEIYTFLLSDDSEVTITGINIPRYYLEHLKSKLQDKIQLSSHQNIPTEKVQTKKSWQEADFVSISDMPGSYKWQNVDLNKVKEQSYSLTFGPFGDDLIYWVIDSIHIRLGKKKLLIDFIKDDFVDDDTYLCSVTARLYGAKTDLYIEEELLQSETRYFKKDVKCDNTLFSDLKI